MAWMLENSGNSCIAVDSRAAPGQNKLSEMTVIQNPWKSLENQHSQLLQLMPKLQGSGGLRLGAPECLGNPLETIGIPCVSCSPDPPEPHVARLPSQKRTGNDGYSETLVKHRKTMISSVCS